jgi:hypothetical protein
MGRFIAMATEWLLLGDKERDLIAPPTSGTDKRRRKKTRQAAPIGATALSFAGPLKIVGFTVGPVAFVSRKSRCVLKLVFWWRCHYV